MTVEKIDSLVLEYTNKINQISKTLSVVAETEEDTTVINTLKVSMKNEERTFIDSVSTLIAKGIVESQESSSTYGSNLEGTFREEAALKIMRQEFSSMSFDRHVPKDDECVGKYSAKTLKHMFLGERNMILPIVTIYKEVFRGKKDATKVLDNLIIEINMKKPIFFENIFGGI